MNTKIEIKINEPEEVIGEGNVEILTPIQPGKAAQELIRAIGLEAYNAVLIFENIKREITLLDGQKKLHIYYQLIKGFIYALATQDYSYMHVYMAKECLKNKTDDPKAADILARELNNYLKILRIKVKPPEKFKQLLQQTVDAINVASDPKYSDTALDILFIDPLDPEDDAITENTFIQRDLFIIDKYFMQLLKEIGKKGEKIAKEILPHRKERARDPLSFWINFPTTDENTPIYWSPVIQILTDAIWFDRVEKNIKFGQENVTALTKPVLNEITAILSPLNQVTRHEEEQIIKVVNQQIIIGSALIPAISPTLINCVFKGATKLNTVTGHRLIRHFPIAAFNAKATGISDYRVIKYERGATELAERLGLHGKQHVSNIKEIIHAMAYIEFKQDRISGNLIQLSKVISASTYRREAYVITVGTPLLPYQTFEDGGLLIPLLKDPPLVNPNQYHAHQYLLQMEIMTVFSNKSVDLAIRKCIEISPEEWEAIALSCGIPKELLKRILDRWTQDGNDAPKFLEHIEGNFYTLGNEHRKELDFLRKQGEKRKSQSIRGLISAQRKNSKPDKN